MKKEKKNKPVEGQEDFILKKIRYYQGTIKDYDDFWNQKIAQGISEESPETKSFAKRNAELNKAYEIVPVEKDDTVMAKDVVSGKDLDDTPKENPDAKPTGNEEGGKDAKKEAGLEAGKEGEKVEKSEKKKEKKEEKHEEEEEMKVEDAKKEEKGEDDDDDDKKIRKVKKKVKKEKKDDK